MQPRVNDTSPLLFLDLGSLVNYHLAKVNIAKAAGISMLITGLYM